MHEALIEIARVIATAHHRWRNRLGRRPLSGEISRLEERLHRIEAENELLRRRILRIPARRRPYYRPWERLEIRWHRTRYRLSIDATARAFALTRIDRPASPSRKCGTPRELRTQPSASMSQIGCSPCASLHDLARIASLNWSRRPTSDTIAWKPGNRVSRSFRS